MWISLKSVRVVIRDSDREGEKLYLILIRDLLCLCLVSDSDSSALRNANLMKSSKRISCNGNIFISSRWEIHYKNNK